jgi:putative ABC transport system permease protein
MIKNNLLFALRLFARSKIFSIAAIAGLSISIAATILVVDYARFELSYDTSFVKAGQIYRVQHNRWTNNELLTKRAMSIPEVGSAMKDYFHEIELTTRLFPVSLNIEPVFTATLRTGEQRSFSEPNAYAADNNFIRVFDLNFIHGDPNTALDGLDRTIISESAAQRYFGRTDVVGEIIRGKDGDLTITGVFKDLPVNTHFRFDMLLSWFEMYDPNVSRFTYDGFYNFILLKHSARVDEINDRLDDFALAYTGDFYKGRPGTHSEFVLQPLTSIHLDSHLDGEMTAGGSRNVVNALLLVALFMIVIAIINHVNLNASKSLQRTKEIMVRKTIGSTRKQLTMQFLSEAFVLSFGAVAGGLILAMLLYPRFNAMFSSQISLNVLREPSFWMTMTLFIIATSVVTGLYPIFLLARVRTNHPSGSASKIYFQKSLVTAQFTLSLILIIATFALHKQVRFMQTQDLGFRLDQKLVIKLLPSYGEEGDSTFIERMSTIKKELELRSLSESSTISSSIPGRKNEWRGSAGLKGEGDAAVIRTTLTRVDPEFIETFGLKIVAGRNFSDSPTESGLIVNTEAAKQFGFNDPAHIIGQNVDMMGVREVIGVVESFHEAGLHETLQPSMFIVGAGFTKFLTVSMKVGDVHNQLAEIGNIWKSQFQHKPFQYFFLDEYFNRQYEADVTMGKSIGAFSALAILISCLGLFSLSLFTVHRKTKEIGIKKVLGASVTFITSELCRNFIAPVCMSAVIGIPVGYYVVTWWLQQYSYRFELTLPLFAIPLLVLVSIGICTVVFQSFRAASRNPVDCLKYE